MSAGIDDRRKRSTELRRSLVRSDLGDVFFSRRAGHRRKTDRITGGRLTAHGSVSGYLEAVNVHQRSTFAIYPVVGASRVACHFPPEMLPEVARGLGRYVTVTGRLRYLEGRALPTEVVVERLEVHPPPDEAPSLRSIRGLAPQLTGGRESVAFLRQLRGADDP